MDVLSSAQTLHEWLGTLGWSGALRVQPAPDLLFLGGETIYRGCSNNDPAAPHCTTIVSQAITKKVCNARLCGSAGPMVFTSFIICPGWDWICSFTFLCSETRLSKSCVHYWHRCTLADQYWTLILS